MSTAEDMGAERADSCLAVPADQFPKIDEHSMADLFKDAVGDDKDDVTYTNSDKDHKGNDGPPVPLEGSSLKTKKGHLKNIIGWGEKDIFQE